MQFLVMFVSMVGPFLYAATNHIDKHLLTRYFKEGGTGTLIMFSSLLSILVVPVAYVAEPDVFGIGLMNVAVLAVSGSLNILLLWLYLQALDGDDPTVVIIFYQLVPVFAVGLSYLILGEKISVAQAIAMVVIIGGTTIIGFDIDADNKIRMKIKTTLLMLGATACWALESVLFKAVALEEEVWRSLFWENILMALVGVIIYVVSPTYRGHFLRALRDNSRAIIGLNVLNETLYVVGNSVSAFAFMMAPISLVLLMNSFQPIFVFGIGLALTFYFPHLGGESMSKVHLTQRLVAIVITGIGTVLLLNAG